MKLVVLIVKSHHVYLEPYSLSYQLYQQNIDVHIHHKLNNVDLSLKLL